MNFTDIPDDTLDDKDFEEIDDDNYYFNCNHSDYENKKN